MATAPLSVDGHYSPLATPTRSSLRREGRRGPGSVTNSVRFSGIFPRDSTDGSEDYAVVRVQEQSPGVDSAILNKFFNEFTASPRLLSPASSRGTCGTPGPRGTSRASKSLRSAPVTPVSKIHKKSVTSHGEGTLVSTSHVPSEWETPGPRWVFSKRRVNNAYKLDDLTRGNTALLVATRPVIKDGILSSHVNAFNALLCKSWTRQEVEQAHVRGFFRRMNPHLSAPQLQCPAALLLARCARLQPAVLPPLARDVCAALPLLIASGRADTRQAGLCLLGLLWRATACGPSQLHTHILSTPRLLELLTARAVDGDLDALWAVREVAEDAAGAIALESSGALRAVCGVLQGLVAAAAEDEEGGGGDDSGGRGVRRKLQYGGGSDGGAAAGAPPPGKRGGTSGAAWAVSRAPAAEAATGRTAAAVEGAAVTEGGAAVEMAAKGVLVADCLAAFSDIISGATAMCKPHTRSGAPSPTYAPERLVTLLLHTHRCCQLGPERPTGHSAAHSATADGSGAEGQRVAEGEGGRQSAAGEGAAGLEAPQGSAAGGDDGCDRLRRLPPGQRSGLQLREALLRCLHAIASCGMGREPQEAVQRALRDAGAPLMELLAQVLQERVQLAGCNAAAYLLWLTASGDFSISAATELNMLRSRMAAAAPQPQPRAAGEDGSHSGGSGDSSGGLGVVHAVSELLLRHLANWRDASLGEDCVGAVRTTCPSTAKSGSGSGPEAGSMAGNDAGEKEGSAASVDRQGSPTAASSDSLQQQEQQQQHGSGGCGSDAVVTEGSAEARTPAPAPPRPPVGSTGLLLTPRGSMPVSASTASPQRYAAGSSDDEEAEEVEEEQQLNSSPSGSKQRSAGRGANEESTPDRGDDGSKLVSAPSHDNTTENMDSNVIDSSVELTGKEHIMQAIQGAASSLQQEAAAPATAASATATKDSPHPMDNSSTPATQRYPALTTAVEGKCVVATDTLTSPAATSDWAAGSASSPYGAPRDSGSGMITGSSGAAAAGGDATSSGPRRPAALVVPSASPEREPKGATAGPAAAAAAAAAAVTLAARLDVVRKIRSRRPPGPAPAPAEVQNLLSNCVGLLAATALSVSGCRGICECAGLLPYITSLFAVPEVAPSSAAAAAVSGSSVDLRLQLLALLANLTMHQEGATAVAAAKAADGTTLPCALYGTAKQSGELVRSGATSWRTGLQLLEPCFSVFTNLHRAHAKLDLPLDPQSGSPQDSFSLAVGALAMQLPGPMGHPDRVRLRSAAARLLDSAIAAYEGVGRTVPPAVVSELISLLSGCCFGSGIMATATTTATGGFGSPSSSIDMGSGGGGSGVRDEVAERAACDAGGALWQLMAAGQVHPDDVATALQGPLASILRKSTDSINPSLIRAALGLVSCLARARSVAQRLWTTPVVPAVLVAHSRAREAGREDVVSCVVEVCQQLVRACHKVERVGAGGGGAGGKVVVSGVDKRVDKWGWLEKVLAQVGCVVEYDNEAEALVLVPKQ